MNARSRLIGSTPPGTACKPPLVAVRDGPIALSAPHTSPEDERTPDVLASGVLCAVRLEARAPEVAEEGTPLVQGEREVSSVPVPGVSDVRATCVLSDFDTLSSVLGVAGRAPLIHC